MSDCCGNMLKYIIFLCNFVIFVTGSVVFGFGVAAQLKVTEMSGFLDENYFHSSIILMVAGGVIMLVTFFGCCGVCTESPCLLYTYGTLLTLILLLEIGAVVTAVILKDDAEIAITEGFQANLMNYGKDNATTEAWGQIQSGLKCCGVDSFKDWEQVDTVPKGDVPDSCCVSEISGCGKGAANATLDSGDDERIHTTGCLVKVKDFLAENLAIVAGVAAGVVVLQLLGIVVVCCLANRMREQKQYV